MELMRHIWKNKKEHFLSGFPSRFVCLRILFRLLTLRNTISELYNGRGINFQKKYLFETVTHLETQVLSVTCALALGMRRSHLILYFSIILQ